MFKKKVQRSYDLVEPEVVDSMDENQLLKHYFPEYNHIQRKEIGFKLMHNANCSNLQELNLELHRFLISSEKQKTADLDKLVYSIVMNCLAYEGNEEIKETLYKDYYDARIKKHSKPFIAGQLRIYEEAYEGLFFAAEKEVQVTTSNIERIIKLVLDISLNHSSNVQKLEAHLIEFKNK
jgi:hypothetical protein